MIEFTLYGIENEKFQRLECLLAIVMSDMHMAYTVEKIHDIDVIVRSGIGVIPSLFYKSNLISGDQVPDIDEFRIRIEKAINFKYPPKPKKSNS
jgi:uncharacterized protein YccT (UPF0319 family)